MDPIAYLDVCCLKRPFDDQRQERIRLESAAVAALMARAPGSHPAPRSLTGTSSRTGETRERTTVTRIASATLSEYELRFEGWTALTERLGVSGAIRFLMQCDTGHGNYTEERQALFRELAHDAILSELQAQSDNRRDSDRRPKLGGKESET